MPRVDRRLMKNYAGYMSKKNLKNRSGFTLMELLVVTSILAALAVVVFTALNPVQRIKEANDSRRQADVDSLLTSIHQYIVDNEGNLPAGMSTGMAEIQLGTDTSGCAVSSGGCAAVGTACLNLTSPLSSYLKTMPVDPVSGSAGKTSYTVVVDSNNIITVRACGAQAATAILSSR